MDSTMDLFNFLICMVNKVFVTMVTVDILNVAILNGKFDFFIETSGETDFFLKIIFFLLQLSNYNHKECKYIKLL
ncbi:hypothetical protein KUTeg_005195 [Tegillarca granosa]|uniref:Uncharacterized protein n=1 Tax=Tegillarca granosa TaxID=220873 RepID=A0ABQ9FM80_TEGGR|nr:hypothetical protein KUTeg_005195 [Tegillarca granosa]